MRTDGMLLREIAAEFGLSIQTVHEWVTDPDGVKRAAKRARYAGVCVDCGAPTDGSDGPGKASARCIECHARWWRENFAIWDRERIITAVRAWAAEHNGTPPSATDWNPQQARLLGRPEKAEKFYADAAWPFVSTVVDYFGTWNAAITAAGLQPRRPSHYGQPGESVSTDDIVALYRSGLSLSQISKRLGISPSGASARLKAAGVQLRPQGGQQRTAA